MDGPGRAPPYEEDYSLPSYDYENLFAELVSAVKQKDRASIQMHVLKTNNLIEMEEMPMYFMVKYCIVVAALLSKDWHWEVAQVSSCFMSVLVVEQDINGRAQRVQCVGEACWRTIFEHACDRGDPEAYIALHELREYLNRLERLRLRADVVYFQLPEHELCTEGIYDFVEGDRPPRYTIKDLDMPPPYHELFVTQQRKPAAKKVATKKSKIVVLRVALPIHKAITGRKRKRTCSSAAAIPTRALRSASRIEAEI
jgi:hypothetical protein